MIKLLKLLNHAFHPPTACFLVTYTHIRGGRGGRADRYICTYVSIYVDICIYTHIYLRINQQTPA